MDYQLAKELKKAGFPQDAHTDDFFDVASSPEERTSRPTLEELIDACGEKCQILEITPG